MIEKEMEDLLAAYPDEFFPRHTFILGRPVPSWYTWEQRGRKYNFNTRAGESGMRACPIEAFGTKTFKDELR